MVTQSGPLLHSNLASADHPVVREIVRRGREGIRGNSGQSSKLGLVVEGGGMRGIYSGGLLVGMEELGLADVFDQVYGESAGAINACYFLAGQGAFGIRIYLEDLTSLKFVNPLRFGTMLDVGYAIDVVVKSVKPLDVERVLRSPSDLYIAVTHGVTGQARVIDVKREGIPLLTLLKATGAIVPLYNHAVYIQGQPYVDGGISSPIPVQAAIDGGCTDILVLVTRSAEFLSTKFTRLQRLCLSPLFRKWSPDFVESFYQRQSLRYNATREIAFGRKIVKDGIKIAVIGPSKNSPPIDRSTISREKLTAAKEDAVRTAKEVFRELVSERR